MSISRHIIFISETKTPMMEFIIQSLKEIGEESGQKPKYSDPEFNDNYEYYSPSIWIYPEGSTMDDFGESKLFNEKLKYWCYLGGTNKIFKKDIKRYMYSVSVFEKLMEKIENSNIENDVTLLICNDIGGYVNKYKPKWSLKWTGKFL